METNSKGIFFKAILVVIAIGIWAIVLQNAGIIPTSQNVYVEGGDIDADVSGSVSVDNKVSVSIDEVLGQNGQKYYYNNR